MSKIIFIKYLPLVSLKLVPKLKMLLIYWNLAHCMFQIYWFRFWYQKLFLWNIYQLLGQINPKTKLLRNPCLIFQVFQSRRRYMINVFWTFTTRYAKIGPHVWVPISITKRKNFIMKYTACAYYWTIHNTFSRCFITLCVRLFFHLY